MNTIPPSLSEMRELQSRLREWLLPTPVMRCRGLESWLGGDAELYAKLEFLQRTGTFKARGALSVVLSLDEDQRAAGITAVSAGNHAIAAAFAASVVGISAKVVMIESASPARVERCLDYGAEVVFARNAHEAFEMVEKIRDDERRFFVHPFEGPFTALGTATVGLEIYEQISDIDTVIVPVGGGGLIGGIACAIKQLNPGCRVIGVEPEGADSMHRSFGSGKPETLQEVQTIADSLGAPFALDYSFSLCRDNVDDLVKVSDLEIRRAMGVLFREMRLAVEPACAATTAAVEGPLRGQLRDKKVVLLFCGSNIDWETFSRDAVLEDECAA